LCRGTFQLPQLGYGYRAKRVRIRRFPADHHRVDIGRDDQRLDPELAGQDGRGQVFVDHRLDTVQHAGGVPDHRDAATARADDHESGIEQNAAPCRRDWSSRFRPAQSALARHDRIGSAD